MSLIDEIKEIMGQGPTLEDIQATKENHEDIVRQHKQIMSNAIITVQEGKVTVALDDDTMFRIDPRRGIHELTTDGKEWKRIECRAMKVMNNELNMMLVSLESFVAGMTLHAFKDHA